MIASITILLKKLHHKHWQGIIVYESSMPQSGILEKITSEILILFPHQLYDKHPFFRLDVPIFLMEEYLFFSQYRFHKKKLLLHRASMKHWQWEMQQQGFQVVYVEAADNPLHDVRNFITTAVRHGLKNIWFIDPEDYWLQKRILQTATACGIHCMEGHNPNFINDGKKAAAFFEGKQHYHQTDFYIAQRKLHQWLLEPDGKPMGGKWTYDSDNRAKIPAGTKIPVPGSGARSECISEAQLYIDRFFAGNYGDTRSFIYPITRKDALKWLHRFLQERFEKFGVYEDAMIASEHYLFHSVLTPMLNIGLLYPGEILEAALEKASEANIPLNALEGFLRQIAGWREFIRVVYRLKGTKQRSTNYWGFTRKIPPQCWTGTTGIVPFDVVVKKLLQTAYNHHIERLMVIGNFFLLCEFDPDDVYRWFMEMYIDAYDWVMVPNVYGMTQFADGGLMTTKPYISGSNYLMKMGDWPKGPWQHTWDGLFWRFMHVHRDFFTTNPRLGMLIKTFDKMEQKKKTQHLDFADNFLKQLDSWNTGQ